MKPVRYLPQALREMFRAAAWYDRRCEGLGDELVAEVEVAASNAAEAPLRWLRASRRTRRVLVHRFPYAVVSFEGTATLWILAVAHGKRRPAYWERRMKDVPEQESQMDQD